MFQEFYHCHLLAFLKILEFNEILKVLIYRFYRDSRCQESNWGPFDYESRTTSQMTSLYRQFTTLKRISPHFFYGFDSRFGEKTRYLESFGI